MTVILQVPYSIVKTMSAGWDQTADELNGGWRRLALTEPRELSAEICAALSAFGDAWIDEFKAIGERAQGYADELRLHIKTMAMADEREADHFRSLLPWEVRDAPTKAPSPLSSAPGAQGLGR